MSINLKFITSFALIFFALDASYALGREHEYKVRVVNEKREPLENINIKTKNVKGYDQNSSSCITSADGRCSLKFSAFAPRDTVVVVTLNQAEYASKPHTLPQVENEFFSNKSSIDVTLVFELESIKTRRQVALDQRNRWGLSNGPKLDEITTVEPTHMVDFLKRKRNSIAPSDVRGKFETEDEYNSRIKKTRNSLIYFDLPVDDGGMCKSDYTHSTGIYKVWCNFGGVDYPIAKFKSSGDPFVLSNAYDKREIKRILLNTVYMPVNIDFDLEFLMDKNSAQFLDADMAIGFLSNGEVDVKSSCDLCESRDRQDETGKIINNLNSLSESLSAVTNQKRTYTSAPKNWKDDAFRDGSIIEDWNHQIKSDAISSVIIFRKSDKRVLLNINQN